MSLYSSKTLISTPHSVLQAKRKLVGIMNFTNPGTVSHNEVRILGAGKHGLDPTLCRGGAAATVSADAVSRCTEACNIQGSTPLLSSLNNRVRLTLGTKALHSCLQQVLLRNKQDTRPVVTVLLCHFSSQCPPESSRSVCTWERSSCTPLQACSLRLC